MTLSEVSSSRSHWYPPCAVRQSTPRISGCRTATTRRSCSSRGRWRASSASVSRLFASSLRSRGWRPLMRWRVQACGYEQRTSDWEVARRSQWRCRRGRWRDSLRTRSAFRALRDGARQGEDGPGRLTSPSLFCVKRVVLAAVRVQYCSQVWSSASWWAVN